MNYRHIAMSALFCMASLTPASAGGPRAVIELFTSQGCSSCPPADKLLGELARDPSLITLSLAVDYWDYLGWKDTLALRGHSNRERAYADARGDRDVFTPQVVVNGLVDVLGSDRAAIDDAIAARSPSWSAVSTELLIVFSVPPMSGVTSLRFALSRGAVTCTASSWFTADPSVALATRMSSSAARLSSYCLGAYPSATNFTR